MKVEQKTELPIFFDVTGRRWRRFKIWAAFIFITIVALTTWEAYRVASFDDFKRVPEAATSASQLADSLSHINVPVIGEGPLVRLVKVENRTTVREVFRNSLPRHLGQDDRVIVGKHDYAIERYGVTHGKRIIMTFDDGPDVIYTNQLLNLLSQEAVPATFFVVGRSVVQHPDIIQRMVREGHGIANHSFTHANLEVIPPAIAEQEVNLTKRTMRAVSGYDSSFFRPPYVGVDDQSLRNSLHGIVVAQKLGYTLALYDYDTKDWQQHIEGAAIPMPPFDGRDHVMLMHDGGGDRSATITYVQRLIQEARRHGYSFAAMHSLYPGEKSYFQPMAPSPEDEVTVTAMQAILIWPLQVTFALFSVTVLFVFIGLGLYVVLAIVQKKRTKEYAVLKKSDFSPAVTVVVPAYNEEKVLKSCIVGLRKSAYSNLKIYIVDDGSTDKTWRIARRLEKKYDNVRAFRQENAGKAAAINLAIKRTWSPVIIGVDADTVFLPDTIDRLVRHFKDPSIGAVAGMVQVGNCSNLLTRCQFLEYSTSISLERTAQAYLNAIMVVPGACGAWRRKAIVSAGRYSSVTLAEDCDLTIGIHAAGYKVVQDNTAISMTEAPTDIRSFARQRFRWAFGNAQVYWKYKSLLVHRKRDWLNTFVLPLAIVSTIGPVLFLPLLGVITLQNILHGQYAVLLIFSALSLVFQLVRAFVALRLGNERLSFVWIVPVARLLYGPLRVYLLYGTLLKAFQGEPVGWNKFARVGAALHASRRSTRSLFGLKT